ncbi:hypothetical protein Cni_G29353 [Canna indica]|uniref:Uncharacterized protein n=1 Tax=Canna indica TaxID=4628 RepID=A0AAQ3QTH2_9LILI|nr:hypothetical protein Cni_G29353 [Canna indica]
MKGRRSRRPLPLLEVVVVAAAATVPPIPARPAQHRAAATLRPSRHSPEDDVELMERLPRLQHPALLASMAAAISDVAQTRCVFCALGKRPDHETIDAARARIAEVDEDLYRQLKEIA